MQFRNGTKYSVRKLNQSHPHWQNIEKIVPKKSKAGTGPYSLHELWDIRWRKKPFPWSYFGEFKPGRRFFFHGTDAITIQNIIDEGFKIVPAKHGRMLGDGIYATYHTNKVMLYGSDNYVISVMVYSPNRYCINPGQSVDGVAVQNAPNRWEALEVRTDSFVMGYKMKNHEICVYDTRRIIPRFILRIG